MIRRRRTFITSVVAASLALALSACGGGGAARNADAGPGAAGSSATAPSSHTGTSTTVTTTSGAGVGSAARSGATQLSGPAPIRLPWTPKIPVDARVSPQCVQPGQTVQLFVVTKPASGIAYQAMYADNKGGGGAPFGAGYGGNSSGYAAQNGDYTSTWVISKTAPAGPARVDVVVGFQGKWGYAGPEFVVEGAGPTGGC